MQPVLSPPSDVSAGAFDKAGAALARESLQERRAALRLAFDGQPKPARLLTDHRRLVDQVLREVWRALGMPKSLSLLAVGGFGRGELFPYSDVDLLVLLPGAPDEALRVQLEALVGRLWDLGLEVGHSVRTVEECIDEASRDITVRTAMLEARWIAGSRALYRRFSAEAHQFDHRDFLAAKELEQEHRHAKYHDSPYSLEPNIKESPGGLRDLQVIRWIALACGFGNSWNDLACRGFITARESLEAMRHERFLQQIRIRLHYAAGRREDRLLFDHQDRVARLLGFAPSATKRASEQLMQRYYRTAKAVTQLNTLLMQNMAAAIGPEPSRVAEPVDERFQVIQGLLDVRDEADRKSTRLNSSHTDISRMPSSA